MNPLQSTTIIAVATVIVAVGCVTGQDFTAAVVAPEAPGGLVATAGNGQVDLSWTAVGNASTFTVYFSTTPGAGKTGTAVSGITTASRTVTGLTNGTTYYFVVTASNSGGESAGTSNETSATPVDPQQWLVGTWRFVALSAGPGAGWQRGTLAVDGGGAVTFTAGTPTNVCYADSAGGTVPPSGFLSSLFVDASGRVMDNPSAAAAAFTGNMGMTRKNLIVMTASSATAQSIAILTRHDPNITFVAGAGSGSDIAGWGSAGGPRKVVYNQITTGAGPQEWEFAAGQIGQTPSIQYASSNGGTVPMPYLSASGATGAPRPTNKDTSLAIDMNGVVSETVTGVTTNTHPVFLLDSGFMTDDKTLIVGVGLALDPQAPAGFSVTGRYVLRVYHVTNAASTANYKDTMNGVLGDLAGTYAFRELIAGASPISASGTLSVDGSGNVAYSSYTASSGVAPGSFTLAMLPQDLNLNASHGVTDIDQFWGVLASNSDVSLNGKLSYNKDMFIFTRTEPSGLSSFIIAVK